MNSKIITTALIGIGVLGAPAFSATPAPAYGAGQAQAYGAEQAPASGEEQGRPGIVNYVEGGVFIDGRQLNPRQVGNVEVNPGEVLSTGAGKAEMLLTPGVFLRLDDHSAVKMISPDLTRTQVGLENGRAAVEVDEIYPQNDLQILDADVTTQLVKPGFYEFTTNPATAMVFTGKAAVEEGDGKYKTIKDHHEMTLAEGAKEKSVDFNTRDAQDEFYNWSSLRSQYLAEANDQIAGEYAGVAGFDPGWYWDPYMWDYTFIGMGPFWSPFGFGFFPPWGWYGGYWGGGFYHGRFYGHEGFRGRGNFGHAGFRSNGGFRGNGGFHGGGFHGSGFGGGGFGGGGFHGGGGRR